MKILMLAPQPFYTERGTPIAVRLAVTALCRAGHQIDLLTYHEGEDIELENLRLLRIAKPPFVANVPIGFSLKKILCDLWLTVAAYRRLRLVEYDVVHAVEESVYPALAARLRFHFRLIYDMDSLILDQLIQKWPVLRVARRALSWCERAAIMRADIILAVCPAVADYARTLTSHDKVHLVPDVAFPLPLGQLPSPAIGAPAVDDLRAQFPNAGALLLYVGNLEQYQGIDLLLDSMAASSSATSCNLAIVGGGARALAHYRGKADALALGHRVQFLGPRPLSQLPELLAQADILCSPRLVGSNTPMKIYSYMAAGRAILATDISSHTQVLDARSACLVAPVREAFAQGLLHLSTHAAVRAELGARAAQIARDHYSFAAFEHRLLRAYEDLEAPRRQFAT